MTRSLSRASSIGAAVLLLQGSVPVDSSQIGPNLLPDQKSISCASGPLQLLYRPLTTPVAGLQASGDIPLPTLGPIAPSGKHPYGTFFPPPGYVEGGTFPALDASQGNRPGLFVAEWNVARGKGLEGLIRTMREVDADVWILNETDLYGGPAAGRVIAQEMARALGYSYVTTVEFYELRDDRRGMSGNAIVSRYPFKSARRMYIPMYVEGEPKIDLDGNGFIEGDEATTGGHDWADPKSLAGGVEPRCGQRSAVSAYIEVPNAAGTTTLINIISIHTENLEGSANLEIRGPKIRWLQTQAVRRILVVPGEPTVMAGDLNTLADEPLAFQSLLRQEFQRADARPGEGAARAFVDCSFGDPRSTHKVGLLPAAHLDWILVQEGYSGAISCSRDTYRIIDSPASDHMIVASRIFVRGAPTPP
ncbi:MAG TPA: endonuclease/exonuclease/phosphatase family protein [Vicinamibacterales bacterium]